MEEINSADGLQLVWQGTAGEAVGACGDREPHQPGDR